MRWTLNKKFLVPAIFSLIIINAGLFFMVRSVIKNFYFTILRENVIPVIQQRMEVGLRPEDFYVPKGARMQPSTRLLEKIAATKDVLKTFAREIKLGELTNVTIWDTYFTAVISDHKELSGLSFTHEPNVKKAYSGEVVTALQKLHYKNPAKAFKVYLPVKDAKAAVLAVAELDYDATSFEKTLSRIASLLASALTVGIALLAIILTYLFHKFLSAPIKKLQAATRPISKGELGDYILIKQRDEIGDLAENFNNMIKGLNNLSGEISRLKEVDRLKSEFVSITAHQLRTPLSGIKWGLEKLHPVPSQADLVEKISKQNEEITKTVNDLLDAARIEEVGMTYKFDDVDLNETIDKILALYEKTIGEKNIDLSLLKSGTQPIIIDADVKKLEIVFSNLISNAVEYTPSGGKIEIEINVQEKSVETRIKDSGIGVAKEDLARIFNKFFRGKNAIALHPDGLGIGLFISKNITEAHKGEMRVESELGKGTTFYVKLPVKQNVNS